jgi:hypothetical protein
MLLQQINHAYDLIRGQKFENIIPILTSNGYEKNFAKDMEENIRLELGSYVRMKYQDGYGTGELI